ncbi:acyl-CoA thioesterase [Dasania marina]|uniref:acyl-CoA thioesterase n=1 Tax=Dasania marina TaxID=471499 RepID=UPI0003660195|nr:acyl-CoA thioesterase [Dasania marina]|tara:strand:+ start:12144 stop:12548 length:405 start_codon:yes stop_codon:yes gene_type:complete
MNVTIDLDDQAPTPNGDLMLQTVAMPADTNPAGDIFAGWLVSQMDIAGAIKAVNVTHTRVVTVAIDSMHFLTSVRIGSVVTCYAEVVEVGRTSVRVKMEVWIDYHNSPTPIKVTECEIVYVSVNPQGQTVPIEQ